MTAGGTMTLHLRRQVLARDARGYTVWRATEESRSLDPARTALVLCDVWDRHWCRGAEERLAKLLPRMNAVCASLRRRGVLIVHAPSNTMAFYEDHPARRRALEAPAVAPPADLPHDDPPLPVDDSDAGSDTGDGPGTQPWTRQHPAIEIDPERDVVSDRGPELHNVYRSRGIDDMLIMGVHTNMCILHRGFAIKQMVRWGYRVALVRDLTDSLYNPARPPYVSHDEGTRLVVEYIEKFWCPTVASGDLAD